MNQIELAQLIAHIAHGAAGQKRADGKTPYIVHPYRVAELTKAIFDCAHQGEPYRDEAIAAAYLHDVIEDTGTTLNDLERVGVYHHVIRLVDILSKPDPSAPAGAPSNATYYTRIAANPLALIVKCADRCANLESVAVDIALGEGFIGEKAEKYVAKTVRDIMPLYTNGGRLSFEWKMLDARCVAVTKALNAPVPQTLTAG